MAAGPEYVVQAFLIEEIGEGAISNVVDHRSALSGVAKARYLGEYVLAPGKDDYIIGSYEDADARIPELRGAAIRLSVCDEIARAWNIRTPEFVDDEYDEMPFRYGDVRIIFTDEDGYMKFRLGDFNKEYNPETTDLSERKRLGMEIYDSKIFITNGIIIDISKGRGIPVRVTLEDVDIAIVNGRQEYLDIVYDSEGNKIDQAVTHGIRVDKGGILVGRGEGKGVPPAPPASERSRRRIFIKDPAVSGIHCSIYKKDGVFVIENFSGTFGTLRATLEIRGSRFVWVFSKSIEEPTKLVDQALYAISPTTFIEVRGFWRS